MSKYKGYKKCFIDTETTGVDRKLNHIFQISGCIEDTDGSILEEFNLEFRPHSLESVSQEAFDKTGVTYEELASRETTAAMAYKAFVAILGRHCNKFDRADKMQFIAYNAGFDSDFLREFFLIHGDEYYGSWFFFPQICVCQAMGMFLLDHRSALPNFKLETLCQAAGFTWDETKAHDAMYDIAMTRKLFHYLRKHTRILGE